MKTISAKINALRSKYKLTKGKTVSKLTKEQINTILSLKGYDIPFSVATGPDGAVGHHVEQYLTIHGVSVDQMAVCDLNTGEELKTRKTSSKAKHTVGTMTLNNIINGTYKKSSISEKLKYQIRFEWSDTYHKITHVSFVDMTDKNIQEILLSRYEASRTALTEAVESAKNNKQPIEFSAHQTFGDFEYKGSNSFAFRLPDAIMKKIITISQTVDSRDKMFDIR